MSVDRPQNHLASTRDSKSYFKLIMNNKDKTTKTHKKVNKMNSEELEAAKQNCIQNQGGLESRYGREVEFHIVRNNQNLNSVSA